MKKYNTFTATLILGAIFSGNVMAESTSPNEGLSEIRIKMSQQILENNLAQAKLDGLQKQVEIQALKQQLDNISSTTSVTANQDVKKDEDHSFQFNETIHEEDILSQGNDWKQNVGFVYQDDLDIGMSNNSGMPSKVSLPDSPVVDLTKSEDLDFEAMLQKVTEESKDAEKTVDEVGSYNENMSDINDFKLINVELNKLVIYGDEKKASLKVNYMTNNGYQKIRGSKIVDVNIGSNFNVKNKVSFNVIDINTKGVELKNDNLEKSEFITR